MADATRNDFYLLSLDEVVKIVGEEHKKKGDMPLGLCTHAGFNYSIHDSLPRFLAALKEKGVPVPSLEVTILDANIKGGGEKYYFPTKVVAKTRGGDIIRENVPGLSATELDGYQTKGSKNQPLIYISRVPLAALENLEKAYSNLFSNLRMREEWLTEQECSSRLPRDMREHDILHEILSGEYDSQAKALLDGKIKELTAVASELAGQGKTAYLGRVEKEEKLTLAILHQAYDDVMSKNNTPSMGDLEAAMVERVIRQKLEPLDIPVRAQWVRREGWGDIVDHVRLHHTQHLIEVCPFFTNKEHIGLHTNGFRDAKEGWEGPSIPDIVIGLAKLRGFELS